MEINELKLKRVESLTGDYIGLNNSNFVLEFQEECSSLKEGKWITADYRDGQFLQIVSVNGRFITCRIITTNSKDYLDPKYTTEDTNYYIITHGLSED